MPCLGAARSFTKLTDSTSTAWTKTRQHYQDRAVVRQFKVGNRTVTAVAPCPEDVIVSKLARLDEKDKSFVEAYHAVRPLDPSVIEERIHQSDFEPAIAERACDYIRNLIPLVAASKPTDGGNKDN
jgi:hypothetical protein